MSRSACRPQSKIGFDSSVLRSPELIEDDRRTAVDLELRAVRQPGWHGHLRARQALRQRPQLTDRAVDHLPVRRNGLLEEESFRAHPDRRLQAVDGRVIVGLVLEIGCALLQEPEELVLPVAQFGGVEPPVVERPQQGEVPDPALGSTPKPLNASRSVVR